MASNIRSADRRSATARISTEPDPLGTRQRLVQAMSRALQRRGYHGVGLTELLAEAGAPKGVLYHHFPGGKEQLAVAAIEATAAQLTDSMRSLVAEHAQPLPMMTSWLALAEQQLQRSNFERGCPLATVALETTAEDSAIRTALAEAFAQIRQGLAGLLAGAGIEAVRASRLATLVVAAYEGALLQARVAGDCQPMADTTGLLLTMLQRELNDVASAASSPVATLPTSGSTR
jgi:TetR/AcrR family transcriptional repressor of lmrAB and yxaGH operons